MELTKTHNLKLTASIIAGTTCLMMLITQTLAFLISFAAPNRFPDFAQSPGFVWLASYLPLYLVAFPVFLFIMCKLPNSVAKRDVIKLPAQGFIKWLMISFAGMYLGNILSVIITSIIGAMRSAEVINPIAEIAIGGNIVYNIIFGVLVAPIGEEFIFRHVMYKKLGGYGDKVYIIFSALIFAMFHGNLSQLVYAFLLGMVFAYLVARTHTVKYSLALHMIINLYGMVLSPLALKFPWLLIVFATAILTATIFGVIMFVRTVKAKKIMLEAPTEEMPKNPAKDVILNFGMIAYIICIATLVFVSTVMI